jgi:anti-sigma B factor antagonist
MQLVTRLCAGSPVPTIEVAGEIDVESGPRLREQAGLIMWAHGPQLALDLANVTFIDCAGVSALLAICRSARTLGGSVRLATASPCVRRLARITGLQPVLGIVPVFPHSALAVRRGAATAQKVMT